MSLLKQAESLEPGAKFQRRMRLGAPWSALERLEIGNAKGVDIFHGYLADCKALVHGVDPFNCPSPEVVVFLSASESEPDASP